MIRSESLDLLVIGDGQVAVICHYITSPQMEFGREYFVSQLKFDSAGSAALCAGVASRLGLRTSLLTKVGNDFFGDFALKRWEQAGIDTSYVVRTSQAGTSFSSVALNESGMWTATTYLGANELLKFEDVQQHFGRLEQLPPKIVHLGGYNKLTFSIGEPALKVLKFAKACGALVTFDVVWDPKGWQDDRLDAVRKTIEYTDVCLFNLNEARIIGGGKELEEVVQNILGLGTRIAVIKLGDQGCVVATEEEMLKTPAFRVKAEDSCGAGDAFNAGFIYGLLSNWNLRETARFANAIGAMKTAYVPRGWSFHWEVKREQIDDFLRKCNMKTLRRQALSDRER